MSPRLLNILLLIASGAIYYLLIGPIYTGENTGIWAPEASVQSLIKQRDEYGKTIEGVKPLIKEATDLKAVYEGVDQDTLNKLSIMVPDSISELKLYAELSRIASDAGLPAEISAKDRGKGEYSVNVSVITNYEGFKRFITYYEKSMRLFTLDSVSFSPSDKDEDVKFNIALTTYYISDNKLAK